MDGKKFDPNGYDYVDLGLPSGLLWAKYNIGGTMESHAGLYFQWGDISGYTSSQIGSGDGKKYFMYGDYKYCNGNWSETAITKYNSSDGKTVLDLSDDAARANMGGSWRMPTRSDFEELLSACTWTYYSGLQGYRVFNKSDSSKYIFLPLKGSASGGAVNNVGYSCSFWSNSLSDYSVIYGYGFQADKNGNKQVKNQMSRYAGYNIRGVIDPV